MQSHKCPNISLYKPREEDSQRWEVIFKKALKMGGRKGEKEL